MPRQPRAIRPRQPWMSQSPNRTHHTSCLRLVAGSAWEKMQRTESVQLIPPSQMRPCPKGSHSCPATPRLCAEAKLRRCSGPKSFWRPSKAKRKGINDSSCRELLQLSAVRRARLWLEIYSVRRLLLTEGGFKDFQNINLSTEVVMRATYLLINQGYLPSH